MKISRVGVDLAKQVFQVHGVDGSERPVWRRKLSDRKWIKVLLERVTPSCEIGMEACSRAHHWAMLRHGTDYHPDEAASRGLVL